MQMSAHHSKLLTSTSSGSRRGKRDMTGTGTQAVCPSPDTYVRTHTLITLVSKKQVSYWGNIYGKGQCTN